MPQGVDVHRMTKSRCVVGDHEGYECLVNECIAGGIFSRIVIELAAV